MPAAAANEVVAIAKLFWLQLGSWFAKMQAEC